MIPRALNAPLSWIDPETGATPSGSGCQPTASAAGASSQSGIPSAGDIVIIEHPYVYDRHTVARVVSTGKVMWAVNYRDKYSDSGWTVDKKRKVKNWLPAPAGMTPSDIDEFLQQAADELRVAERRARSSYAESIKAFAQGTPTRSAETTGSVGEADGGPVRQDAPESRTQTHTTKKKGE